MLLAIALFATATFLALGVWQIERRSWKLDLIARVKERVHAPPAPPPAFAPWTEAEARQQEYRHVALTGTFRHDRETLVQALTLRGAGFWVLTPLQTANGLVLVNRGFVPPDKRDPATRKAAQASGQVRVTGLLRLSEPGGGFLRVNDPTANRWYSRDVAAIAGARHLPAVAPYFVDADAAPNPGGYPVGGLTVVKFYNQHLSYALTWFTMAILSAAASLLVLTRGRDR
ncbi:SURF1-like protein [Sphingomonas sp. DBB INV C78]|uniref:SURF1 family protein n=1 Tax=Sphingomonas sp. DBB INV C78 TaxID=3349434 RepID=UPI0036D36D4E